jgi:hypothetical protein
MNRHDFFYLFSGAIFFGYLVAALFFYRFWKQTRDRLFACFAGAFLLLALERIILLSVETEISDKPQVFLARLMAFLLIIWGIWDKNRSPR